MSKKLVAQRRCVACKKLQDKYAMFRVVRTPTDEIRLDLTSKASGHGAYLCKCEACLLLAMKKRNLSHALKAPIPNELYIELAEQILKVNSMPTISEVDLCLSPNKSIESLSCPKN